MATALPAASTATQTTATEGDVKNWLTNLHDYLAGLLGTTGLPADARTALGITVTAAVSSFNTRTGDVTLKSTDVISALGFTPANAANTNDSYGKIGCYVLYYAAWSGTVSNGGTTTVPGYSGTYRMICHYTIASYELHLFQRIA